MMEALDEILRGVQSGKLSVPEASERLLNEMGRGGRVIVVDENLYGLDDALAALNYTTDAVPTGEDDSQIQKRIWNRVFVTINGKDFNDSDSMKKNRYGLIWIRTKQTDYKRLAKAVERALRTHNFYHDLVQTAEITDADMEGGRP